MKEAIKSFIIENYMFGNGDGLEEDTSFVDEGIIDSTGVLELVNFLENEFAIKVADEDLVPENLDSIINIETYINRKKMAA